MNIVYIKLKIIKKSKSIFALKWKTNEKNLGKRNLIFLYFLIFNLDASSI